MTDQINGLDRVAIRQVMASGIEGRGILHRTDQVENQRLQELKAHTK